jgi:hypothetical protein
MQANVTRAGDRFDRRPFRLTEILRMHDDGIVAAGAAPLRFLAHLEPV